MKLRLPLSLLSVLLACYATNISYGIEGEMQSVTWDSAWGISSELIPSSALTVTPVVLSDTL